MANDHPQSITPVGIPADTGVTAGAEIIARTEHYDGRRKEEVYTDADKLKIALLKYKKAIRWQTDWFGVLGIIATISLAFATCDFHDTWIFSALQIEIFFGVCCAILIIVFIYILCKARIHKKQATTKCVIDELKSGNIDADCL